MNMSQHDRHADGSAPIPIVFDTVRRLAMDTTSVTIQVESEIWDVFERICRLKGLETSAALSNAMFLYPGAEPSAALRRFTTRCLLDMVGG